MLEFSEIDPALYAANMSRALGERLGLPGRLLYGDGAFGDMYVSRELSDADRARVHDEAVRAYRAHPQVAAVFTREQLAAAPPPSGPPDAWTLIERARASFVPDRSGDFVEVSWDEALGAIALRLNALIDAGHELVVFDTNDAALEPLRARQHIAYIPEQVALYGTMSGLENLRYFTTLAGLTLEDGRSSDLLSAAGLTKEAQQRPADHQR